jgi:hypothetical protein
LLNKTLQMSYDEQLCRYDIPIFVINDPSSFEEKKAEVAIEEKMLKVDWTLT